MRITSLISLLAAFAPPATTLTTAGCACGDVAYERGLRVDIEVPSAPASYRIEVEAAGESLSLEYAMTADGVQCTMPSGDCQAIGSRIVLQSSFAASPAKLAVNVHNLGDEGGPEEAIVRVFRGTDLVVEQALEPDYETDYPGGRGCGARSLAIETLAVP